MYFYKMIVDLKEYLISLKKIKYIRAFNKKFKAKLLYFMAIAVKLFFSTFDFSET